MEDERGVTLNELVRKGQLAVIVHETGHAAEVVQAPLVDDGHLGAPPLGEDEGIVIKALALGPWHRHVEGRVAAQGEGQVHVAGVGHGKALSERGAVGRVGHVEAEVKGVELACGLVGVKLEGHGGLAPLHDGVLARARDAVPLEAHGPLRAHGLVILKAAYDGEEHRGATGPELGVSLPEIFGPRAREAHELRAH